MAEPSGTPQPALEQGTYDILRARLAQHGADLRERLDRLNTARQQVFGAIKPGLVATERITTKNNCQARDLIPIGGNRFLFGYNVHLGLRTETHLDDVFGVYEFRDHQFHELPLDAIADPQFEADFKSLYRYYKNTVFAKFSIIGPHLFMEFRVGKSISDFKCFKWQIHPEGGISYLGNRFDHEYAFPAQHEFTWTRTHRELHRHGLHPHISVEDRVFVECVGGDLTIKIEDNTASGQGIYSEPVQHRDQTLDDAEIYYAIVGHLILLKVRPYQEPEFRYFVFNEKVREARRIDAIADSCVLLPDDQGIIFARGYYLQSGEFKLFESQLSDMRFYKRIAAPNGEDFLYAFYQREAGHYVLLSYNRIARSVETPLVCGGYSIFDNGEMAVFRPSEEPQKHHAIQVWQTPYVGQSWQPETQPASHLFKIGNPPIVGAMAEAHSVLGLLGKDDTFAGLYLDLVKQTTDLLDSYFWLDHPEAFDLRTPLLAIREAASAALAEFDKVAAIKRNTAAETQRVVGAAEALLGSLPGQTFEAIAHFVTRLAELRALRGELISLRELRYVDLDLAARTEAAVAEASEALAQRTVEFLLKPEALDPVRERVDALRAAAPAVPKVSEAEKLGADIDAAAQELDLLVETVSNLKIQDATETTRIIEAISAIYATLNQARSTLKQRIRDLRGTEAAAEFASQLRLLDQALANYLDLCETPAKCDEFLNRLLVQIEEVEARFADFEDFVVALAEKRTALSSAFEQRKIELVEARNRRANGLLAAAERILKGIKHRAEQASGLDELNSYFAADAMVEKVRDLTRQLLDLGDSVKADDLGSRLKTVREDAVRQWKDRQDLFADGGQAIQLGRHRFLVNTQELDLTIVPRGDRMCLHITGTNFFEPIDDPEFSTTQPVWELQLISETPSIYRAEWLAYQTLKHIEQRRLGDAAAAWTAEQCLPMVRETAASRLSEGYVKGVHDLDAAAILAVLLRMQHGLGLLRYSSAARACAAVFWMQFPEGEHRSLIEAKLKGFGAMKRAFPQAGQRIEYIRELHDLLHEYTQRTGLFPAEVLSDAAEFLYFLITRDVAFPVASEAAHLVAAFEAHLREHRIGDAFRAARHAVEEHLPTHYELLREWLRGFASDRTGSGDWIDEAAWMLLRGTHGGVVEASVSGEVPGLTGGHPRIQGGVMPLHFLDFMHRMRAHENTVAPLFEKFTALKRGRIEEARARLRLDDFKPKVLTSFVRNRLIDAAYLPLIGDNLAKQIGAAGDSKRTDRMGMLLLISPPGYGKTTLIEYVASRLGIIFMKINGPAIGHRVTSLDPAEAPNAAARDELEKLNLAFEMGDNVMVCLDDIQHLHAELLQKFIPLCDGSRRIEGVYRGRPRTYDLRGRKVVVVMAGNPYTESGDKFRIPDMLANRADTYNLGDVAGTHAGAFRDSYLENAAASNPTLARLVARHPKDLPALIRLAESGPGEGIEFEGNWSSEEQQEFVNVMKKLLRVRDVVLRMNEEYIRSAAQSDAYRTEPPFKLQGSYRNMNRLAEKIAPVMNEAELEELLASYYRNEAQTLTTGAEANLLKFKELTSSLTPADAARWEEIKKTFRKNQILGGTGEDDPVSRVVQKLSAFYDGLAGIREALESAMAARPSDADGKRPLIIVTPPASPAGASAGVPSEKPLPSEWTREVAISQETLRKIWDLIEADRHPPPSAPNCTPPPGAS
jgi:hypothetical protein